MLNERCVRVGNPVREGWRGGLSALVVARARALHDLKFALRPLARYEVQHLAVAVPASVGYGESQATGCAGGSIQNLRQVRFWRSSTA